MLKKMSEYEYHYGLKVRIYPSTKQKQIIAASSNASRFVYNKMVELGKEIAAFGKPSVYIKIVDERLAQLKELKSSTTVLKIDSHGFVPRKLTHWLLKTPNNLTIRRGICIVRYTIFLPQTSIRKATRRNTRLLLSTTKRKSVLPP